MKIRDDKRRPAIMSVTEAKKKIDSFHSGGYRDELPLPKVRKFNNKRKKRKVEVTITTFQSMYIEGIGGSHFYISLEEEGNPLLDRSAEGPAWVDCWDDDDYEGKRFSTRCESKSDAAHFITVTWFKEFSSATHKLCLNVFLVDTDLMSIYKRALKLIKERESIRS